MTDAPPGRPNFGNRTIWTGDNLDVMRGWNSGCVDLIYLDPPFNSEKQWAAPIGSEAAGAAFKDSWTLNDINVAEQGLIRTEHPALHAVIEAAGVAHSQSMRSYTIYMGVRLLEMRRILKPAGSIYLHCDPAAGAWLRAAMDAVFGKDRFRNEIVWCYPPTGRPPKIGFPRKTDTILFYAPDEAVFHTQYGPMTAATLATYSSVDEAGRKYSKAHGGRTYLDESRGRAVPNWWDDCGSGSTMPKRERTGYPTQKPLKLLERIIKASSNPGDMVLDPFCGCATACVAAEKLDRQWAGIDVSPLAYSLVQQRLAREVSVGSAETPLLTGWNVTHREDVPQRTDLGDVPPYNSQENRERLYGRQGGDCNGCEVHFLPRNLTVDHIVPQSRGGGHHIDNLQLLCGACNSKKGAGSQAELIARLVAGGIRQ